MKKQEMELGVQPLDEIMRQAGLDNHDLVEISDEQLSHKEVQKGRKGRRLTLNIRHKILNALKKSKPERNFLLSQLFNYA